jgi:REP element-mobilizing transposase RayT
MKWKNLDCDTGVFFITATITEWQMLFMHEQPRNILLSDFEFYRHKYDNRIHSYVIMPEHYHIIVSFKKPDQLHNWLKDVQGHSSNEISKWLRATAHPRHLAVYEKHSNGGAKLAVWKEQARAVGITSLSALRTKIHYLHANPVRRELVDNPEDWKWSSWRNYFLDDDSLFRVDRIDLT